MFYANNFYFNKKLHSSQERDIYMLIKEHYEKGNGGDCFFSKGAKNMNKDDILRIYEYVMLDNPSLFMIPLNALECDVDGDAFEIRSTNESYRKYSAEEKAKALQAISENRSSIANIGDLEERIRRAAFIMHNKCVYYLDNSSVGENVIDFFSSNGVGTGYCTGAARTIATLVNSPYVYCVRGKIKKDFSIIRSEDGSGSNHIFSCYWNTDERRYYFFDACSAIRVANNTELESEIKRKIFRKNYSDGSYEGFEFYTMQKLKERYSFEDEDLWN